MKKLKRIIVLLLAACCSFTAVAAGCGGSGEQQGVTGDKYNVEGANKTVIKFLNPNGGYGHVWIDELAESFAKKHAETSFADGKQGVYIDIVNDMNFKVANIDTSNNDIVLGTTLETMENAAKLYDLTSVVKEQRADGTTIESILIDDVKGVCLVDNKYMGIPYQEFYPGLAYNHKVFDEAKAFFASEETDEIYAGSFATDDVYFTNDAGPKSVGPDGVAGTEDDGLPASLEQFIILLDHLKGKGLNPIGLSGKYLNYSTYFMTALWASLAGAEKMRNYFNCTGELEVCVLDGTESFVMTKEENLFPGIDYIKKPQTTTLTFDGTNGYKGQLMVEKYYAYALFEIMREEGFWSSDVNDSTLSHYGAQYKILDKKCAMLVESTYWYNETRDANNLIELAMTGVSEKDLDIRTMSLPSWIEQADADAATEETRKEASFLDTSSTAIVVNAKVAGTDKEKAVLEFVKFLYEEEQIVDYTMITGMARSVKDYDLPTVDGVYTKNVNGTDYTLSNFYARLWQARKKGGTNVIYCSGTSNEFKLNYRSLSLGLTTPTLKTADSERSNPYNEISTMKKTTKLIFEQTLYKSTDWVLPQA